MATEFLPSTRRALLHRLARAQRDGRAPSLTALVIRDGVPGWCDVRGQVEGGADAAYRIGSITKTFTAVLVLQLRDEGRLRLTDPVGRHLPEVGGEQTLQQLLCHAGGLASELAGDWWERVPGPDFAGLAAAVAGDAGRLPAGARFHYSNLGFALLGEVVARVSGRSWAEQLQQRLLDPLELSRTSLQPRHPAAAGWAVHPHADVLLPEPTPDTAAMAPAGQLWSTAADLGRWARFLGGDTGGVLAPDTLEEMRHPASVDDGARWTTAMGLGLQLRRVDGRALAGHLGSMPGFLAALWTEPATGDAAVALANATSGVAVGTLAEDLLHVLRTEEPALPGPWRPSQVAPELLELTGTWYWGPAPSTVAVEGVDGLRLDGGEAGRSSRFRPRGDGTFVGLDSYFAGERLRPVRDAAGGLTHLDVGTFVFTRQPYDPAEVVPGGVDSSRWRGPAAG